MPSISFSFFQEYGQLFLDGLLTTVILAIVGTVAGLILGVFLAFARNIKVNEEDSAFKKIYKKTIYYLSTIYVQFFRGTPMMVQALIIFFGCGELGFSWDPLLCGIVVISINTAAYMAEIIKSGINAIDKGQIEAARSLGMSHFQTMIHVVFPQALKNSIPSIGNELIVNIKDSSVLNVITITELFYAAKTAYTNTYNIVLAYGTVCVIYLILTLGTSKLLQILENKLNIEQQNKKTEGRKRRFLIFRGRING